MKRFLTILFILFLTTPTFAFLVGPSKPEETKEPPSPAETKPADVKPVNTKPAEERPKPVKRIDTMLAVFDLETTEGVHKSVARPLTDSIRLEVVRAGKYKVIDRSNMDKILGEQKLQLSGCVSGECIVEAGQLLGVGRIITGSVSMVGKTYYLSLSLINVESGEIEKSSEDKCKCEIDDLIESSKRLVKKLMGEAMPEPAIASETKQPPSTPFSKGDFKDPGIEMVYVKGGCYQMGDTFGDGNSDEKPVHEVCPDDFYIGKYEVTQGQWKAIMGNNPSYFKDCGDNCPVEQVSWNDAQEFIRKLNQRTKNNPQAPFGKGEFRLPTEAEWEYAARSGGKSEKYSGGNDIDSVAWYNSNSGSKTHPVGQKKPNGLGLYDMSGNVWEWVNDWYGSYSSGSQNNPKGLSSGPGRVARGGSWLYSARFVRASSRNFFTPDFRGYFLGFRLAGSK